MTVPSLDSPHTVGDDRGVDQRALARYYRVSCCGNNFIIVRLDDESGLEKTKQAAPELIEKHRVDNLLALTRRLAGRYRMRIFEPDGSESEASGNGGLASAYLLFTEELKGTVVQIVMNSATIIVERFGSSLTLVCDQFSSETMAGTTVVRIANEPHVVYFNGGVPGDIDTAFKELSVVCGEAVNVSVVNPLGTNRFQIETFERGVNATTRSCGSASLAAYFWARHCGHVNGNAPALFISAGGTHTVAAVGTAALSLSVDFARDIRCLPI